MAANPKCRCGAKPFESTCHAGGGGLAFYALVSCPDCESKAEAWGKDRERALVKARGHWRRKNG